MAFTRRDRPPMIWFIRENAGTPVKGNLVGTRVLTESFRLVREGGFVQWDPLPSNTFRMRPHA